jgi:hypothetical protein
LTVELRRIEEGKFGHFESKGVYFKNGNFVETEIGNFLKFITIELGLLEMCKIIIDNFR